jgi:hypothetical protein
MKKNIIDNIYYYGKKELLFILTGGVINFFLLLCVFWSGITLADTVFFFSEITRWGLLLINIPLVIFLFLRLVLKPFLNWKKFSQKSDLSPVARQIGYNNPSIKDHLVNLYQIFKSDYKTPLVKAAIDQISDSVGDTYFNKNLTIKNYMPDFKIVFSLVVSSIFIISFQFNDIFNSTKRLLNPSKEYLKIPPFYFSVIPGNKEILHNQPFDLKVQYDGPQVNSINLVLMEDDEPQRTVALEKKKNFYSGRLKQVTKSFEYIVSGTPLLTPELQGYLVSEKYKVKVLIPPRVEDLKIKVTPPFYSGAVPFHNEGNDGNITSLAGSEIQIQLSSNKALESAFLVFNNKDSLKLDNKGRVASGKISVKTNSSYKIILKDTEGVDNQDPITYAVNIIPDNPPYIDITEPGMDVEAQLEGILNLKIDAADDYGLSDIHLKFRYIKQGETADSLWQKISLNNFKSGMLKTGLFHALDFSHFYVGYNDQIEYYAVARDNNKVSGFSLSESPVYKITFPSLDELFEEFSVKEDEKLEDLREIADDAEKLKKDLEELKREISRSDKIDWDLKKQIEGAVERQKTAQEKVENIKKDLEEMTNKLEQNNLISPEMLEKYTQLQELFNEIAPPELLESLKKLQEAMDKANPNDVKKALEDFKLNQEAFQANLERTLELFKQVQLEQQLDQLVQQAENLRKTQENISNSLQEKEKLNDAEKSSLLNDQKLQQEQLKSLQRNLNDLLNKPQLQKFSSAKENLEDTRNRIDEQKLNEKTQEMLEQISNGKMNQSRQNSREMKQSYSEMQQSLQQALQNVQQQNKQNVQKKMLSAAKKMLDLSHEQEKLQHRTKSTSQLNDDIHQRGREQANIRDNLQKLMSDIVELSKETFFVDPQITRGLVNAHENMQKSMDDISERQTSQASEKQHKAMESLNMSINGMQSSMQQMSGASSGTGFEQFMEQLKQMANSQGGLNSETLNFMEGQGNDGQMSLAQQAQRQRMAAQQQAIKQAMEEMSDQMGNRSDILGRLNEMGGEMEEVIQDMLENNIDRRTIDRQRQILSRMLDAQKSVREREHSKKRQAERAKQYIAKDPGSIKNFEDVSQKELQDALKKALSEGYHSDYQRLIEIYFKELSSQKAKN